MPVDAAALRRALARPAGPSSDFDLNPAAVLPPGRSLRAAAVLIAVQLLPGGAQVILTKRASHLQHHPGQIALPGGKIEADDAGPTAAALREAQEEIGLDPTLVEVLGTLPPHETVTGYDVTPVLGLIRAPVVLRPQEDEVAEVFSVPLSHVADPARYSVEGRMWRGGLRRYYVVPFGPYYIWGATARILRGLADRLGP